MNNDQFSFSDDKPLSMNADPRPDTGADAPARADAAPGRAAEPRRAAEEAATAGTAAPASSCAATCPLARIPDNVWKDLLRRPFRKRRPLLFWGGVALALVLGFLLLNVPDEDGPGLFEGVDALALDTVSGPILNVEPTLDWIRRLERNPAVKGVLLRVDSPGGGAAASQELYSALQRLSQAMPVAVSMGSMAASGGLMVSMAGQRVFANASTVTGSIGVRMDIPQLQGLMDKIGVGQETLVTGPYKDAGSYLRPLTPEQRVYFKSVLDDMHAQFVDIVAKGRQMPRSQAAALATGKIFTGREALSLGLVDELGGREAAHRWLSEQTGVPARRKLLTRPKEGSWLERGLKSQLGLDLTALTRAAGLGDDWRTPVFLHQF